LQSNLALRDIKSNSNHLQHKNLIAIKFGASRHQIKLKLVNIFFKFCRILIAIKFGASRHQIKVTLVNIILQNFDCNQIWRFATSNQISTGWSSYQRRPNNSIDSKIHDKKTTMTSLVPALVLTLVPEKIH